MAKLGKSQILANVKNKIYFPIKFHVIPIYLNDSIGLGFNNRLFKIDSKFCNFLQSSKNKTSMGCYGSKDPNKASFRDPADHQENTIKIERVVHHEPAKV